MDQTPEASVTSLGVIHNQLAIIYRQADDVDRTLDHYRQSIRYKEAAGDIFNAGQARRNLAITLRDANRLVDVRAYAEAAIANFATFGDRAAEAFEKAQQILAAINQAIAEQETSQ